jgi:hypothetical protein
VIVGVDPGLTSFGVSNGEDHDAFKTLPNPALTEEESLLFRVFRLCGDLENYLGVEDAELFIEAPQLRVPEHGGSHLYQIGWLMHGLYDFAARRTGEGRVTTIALVQRGTYLKALFGKGVIAETLLAKEVYKKFGVEIDHDRGLDKIEAWLLWKYGCGIQDGSIEPKQRGSVQRGRKSVRSAKH